MVSGEPPSNLEVGHPTVCFEQKTVFLPITAEFKRRYRKVPTRSSKTSDFWNARGTVDADQLRAEGIPPVFIVAALAEIAVSTAKLDPADTDAQLQALLRVATHSNTTRPVAEQFLDSFIAGRPSS